MEKGYVRDVKGSCFSKKIQGNPIACWLLQYDRNATQSSDWVGLVSVYDLAEALDNERKVHGWCHKNMFKHGIVCN